MWVPCVENGLKDKEKVSAANHNTPLPDECLVLSLFRMATGKIIMETKCLHVKESLIMDEFHMQH